MGNVNQIIVDLVESAIKKVEGKYFNVINSNKKVQNRERVFCYELYHQMRQLQDKSFKKLTLNGERDKKGIEDYKKEIPDFIFHIPGTNKNNEAIIEVKNTLRIKRDIHKIDTFIKEHNYEFGILLVYNKTLDDVKKKLNSIKAELDNIENKKDIVIIVASDSANIKYKLLSEIIGV